MNVKEYLCQHNNDIACTKCGYCCTDNCGSKVGNLCQAHPLTNQGQDDRSPLCKLTPVYLTILFGIACPAVLKIINELTGQPDPKMIISTGLHLIQGYRFDKKRGIFINTNSYFRNLLNQEINNSANIQ